MLFTREIEKYLTFQKGSVNQKRSYWVKQIHFNLTAPVDTHSHDVSEVAKTKAL